MRRYVTRWRWCALTLPLSRQASQPASLALPQHDKTSNAVVHGGVCTVPVEADATPTWSSQAVVNDIFAAPDTHSTGAASLSGTRLGSASVFVVLGTALLCCGALMRYVFTYKVILTSDPHMYSARVKEDCICDYAVLEGRWSGRRRVVQVNNTASNETSSSASDVGTSRDGASSTPSTRQASCVLHVNRLKDRLWLYTTPESNIVLLELGAVLSPYRFVTPAHEGRHYVAKPTPAMGEDQRGVLRIASVVRPKAARPGPRQGLVVRYERTLHDVAERKLTERYHDYLLQHRVDSGVRRAWAQTLLEQGSVTGHGVTLSTLVPDLASFAREVWDEVAAAMGRDVVVQDCVMTWLPQGPPSA